MPSSVSPRRPWFDRFAERVSGMVSRAWFFSACVLLIMVWAPSYFLIGSLDSWQLIINTATTIVTFLLVALLQNSQQRSGQATQHKLNALAEGRADLLDALTDEDVPEGEARIRAAARELRCAVGLEERESA